VAAKPFEPPDEANVFKANQGFDRDSLRLYAFSGAAVFKKLHAPAVMRRMRGIRELFYVIGLYS
jgi:hypothetical protein